MINLLGVHNILFFIVFGMLTGCKKEDPPEPEVVITATYYVAPDGSDMNPGTIDKPWVSWVRAFRTAQRGDTVYFRGGVYRKQGAAAISSTNANSGISGYPICYFNYPGEVPILDNEGFMPDGSGNNGIIMQEMEYIHIKGLHIRNIRQYNENIKAIGINLWHCNEITVENASVYNIGGPGMRITDCYTIYITNCDVFNCVDTFNTTTAKSGGVADGFQMLNYDLPHDQSFYYLKGCRAWGCSDDGYDTNCESFIGFESCWAFDNGRLEGDGNGFKYGLMTNPSPPLARSIINCLAAFNKFMGFNENNRLFRSMNIKAYNNTTYSNQIGFGNFGKNIGKIEENQYRNNLSFRDEYPTRFDGTVIESNNSWNIPGITINNEDFISLDTAGLLGPRQEDGSLPDLDFMHPARGSDLIDAGVDVGLPFSGNAPDLGYSEYSSKK